MRQWKLATSSVELERVTNTLAMKHYINCLQLNAFTTWVNFTAHSIEDKKFSFQKELKKTVLNIVTNLLDQFKQRHQKTLRSLVFNTWYQRTRLFMQQKVFAKALYINHQRSKLSMILYKWKIFAVLGKMNVVQESLNAEQLQCSSASREKYRICKSSFTIIKNRLKY